MDAVEFIQDEEFETINQKITGIISLLNIGIFGISQ